MTEVLSYRFGRHERLKSEALIAELYQRGTAISKYPLRFTYMVLEKEAFSDASVKVSINASKKGLRLAVSRNRMKRILKEIYRHHKHPILHQIEKNEQCLALSVVYVGNHLMEYDPLEKLFLKLRRRLLDGLAELPADHS
jgi:ribonuclease P protein component